MRSNVGSPRSFSRKRARSGRTFNDEHDCCVEPVLRPDEIRNDPHMQARGVFLESDTEDGPVGQFRTPVTPANLVVEPAPKSGEHTRAGPSRRGLHRRRDRPPVRGRRRAVGLRFGANAAPTRVQLVAPLDQISVRSQRRMAPDGSRRRPEREIAIRDGSDHLHHAAHHDVGERELVEERLATAESGAQRFQNGDDIADVSLLRVRLEIVLSDEEADTRTGEELAEGPSFRRSEGSSSIRAARLMLMRRTTRLRPASSAVSAIAIHWATSRSYCFGISSEPSPTLSA